MKSVPEKLKNALRTGAAFVVMAAIIMLVLNGYFRYVRDSEQARVDQTVHESAVQSVALIQERVYNNITYIENIGHYLGTVEEPINSTAVLSSLQSLNDQSKMFKTITTATADGKLYDSNGFVIGNISGRPYFIRAMCGVTVISNIERSLDDHKNIISVAAPITRNGKVIGIVNGRFLMTELTHYLSADFFDGRGYSYMANADGKVFVRADHPEADPNFTDIYEGFHPNPSVSDEMLDEMLQTMSEGGEGRIFYEWHGAKRTMSYMPVGINDWYLLSVLPNDIVASRTLEFSKQVFILTVILLLVILLLLRYMRRERRASQDEIIAAHNEILTIYNTIPGGVFKCLVDDEYTVTGANDGFYRFLGCSRERFEQEFENKFARMLGKEDADKIKRSVAAQSATGAVVSNEVRLTGIDGVHKWMLVRGEVAQVPEKEEMIYCCFTDVSELKQAQEKLRNSRQRYELIMSVTQSIIFEWNPFDKTIYHSKTYQKKFGCQPVVDNFPQSVIDGQIVYPEDEETFLGIYRRLEYGAPSAVGEIRIRQANGEYLWCRISTIAIRDEDRCLCRVIGLIEDIDSSKRALQHAQEMTQRDPLTGLYNKTATERLIGERLRKTIGATALLVLDIDNFKGINDTLGHSSGDSILIELSHCLKLLARAGDIVGRVGGDEFVVLLDELEQGDDLEQKLADIASIFQRSFCKEMRECSISCSIGVALHPRDGETFTELFQKADSALYFAKRHGKNRFAMYNEAYGKRA